MKVTITLESNGGNGVKVTCNPPVHKLKAMAKDGVGGAVIGMVGLTLKKLFESAPGEGSLVMPGDDQSFTSKPKTGASGLINPATGRPF